jgi:class 3 adenylate cyclase
LTVVTCPSCGQQNPDGARFCNACASALQVEERGLGEERKIVTVVFVDLVGFTAQAEQLDPEDVRALLAPYHAQVRQELERRGGTVEKFIGDAVMAVFGAPAAHEDDPERAVRAALAIRDWIGEQTDLQVRLAVNTGEALVKLGARPTEGEAMVAGDVVNTAARLQTAAPVNGILVGETTYWATRDAIGYRDGSPVQAKGKVEPIAIWEALEPLSRYGVDVAERAVTPLVGRNRELDLLRTVLGRVRDERSAQLVTIVGVPGVGKSRLVRELFGLIDDEAELITWRQGRCLPYGESVTFWALGEIVKAEVGILENDPHAEVERKLSDAVTRLVPEASEARWLETELRALVGLPSDGAGSETAGGAWRRFLEAVAEQGPAVLVFEDLHWADDGLLDFLDELVDWVRDVPLLLIGTARPELLERRPGWGGGKANATTISLQPLPEPDTARLISSLLERPLQLADDQQALLDRAGGNPLFAEQYVRLLAERGTMGDVPESVQGVIAARLDALPRPAKELLQEAAVHGNVFWAGGVATAAGVEVEEGEALLRSLERKDFVRRERRSVVAGESQYSFHHVLLRDVAYGQIPRRARAEKHRRAAEWIEGLGRPDDHAELLAHHYKQALDLSRATGGEDDPAIVERARESFRRAGERALALASYAAAGDFFADALTLTTADDAERASLLIQQARALVPLGSAAIKPAKEALEACRAAGDAEGAAQAATIAGRASWLSGDRSATDRYMAEALDAVAELPRSRARAEVLANQCGFNMLAGRYQEAIAIGVDALPLVEALGMDEQRARLHILIGCCHCCLGETAGLDEIEDGIRIAEAAGAAEMIAIGYGNLSSELHFFARLDESRQAWTRWMDVCERYGLRRHVLNAEAERAYLAYLDGHWDESVAIADELVALADAGDPHYNQAPLLALRAWIAFARRSAEAADRDSRRAVDLARESDLQAHAQTYTMRAAICLASGARSEADGLASDLVEYGGAITGGLCAAFPSLTDLAWVFRDLGRGGELVERILDPDPIKSAWNDASRAIVDADFVRAADILDEIGHAASAAYARLRAAEAMASAGQDTEAAAQRAQAEAFYRTVGAIRFIGNGEPLETAQGDYLRAPMDG